MDAIDLNLNNYKLIAEHLAKELDNYGKGSNTPEYEERLDRANKAYHLYIRKMNEFLSIEKTKERHLSGWNVSAFDERFPDTNFTVPPKDGLIKKEK